MSILRANLKHLYQNRGAWLWYILILCQTPWILLPLYSKIDRYLGYLMISLLMGVLVGAIQKEVMSKPFTFCLPGHRGVTRPIVFRVGCIMNMVLGCVFFGYPGLGFPYVLLVVLAGGFIGMVIFFHGVYVGLVESSSPLAGITVLLIFCVILFKWDMILQDMISNWPLVIILVSVIVCVWVWILLGRDVLARKYCGKVVMVFFDGWNNEKKLKYQQIQADKNLTEGKVKLFEKMHRIILGRMNQYEYLSRGRYVWGNIYMAFGKTFGIWRKGNMLMTLVTLVCLVVWFGYLGTRDIRMINFLIILPVFYVFGIDILPYRSMLFPAGRRDRYYSSLVLTITITIIAVLLGLALISVSNIMEMALPVISIYGKMLSYHGIEISQIYICFLFIPVILSISALTFRMNFVKFALVIGVFYGWMGFEIGMKGTLVDAIGVIGVTGMIVVCWLVFLVILRYVCMRRSLVGQGG